MLLTAPIEFIYAPSSFSSLPTPPSLSPSRPLYIDEHEPYEELLQSR